MAKQPKKSKRDSVLAIKEGDLVWLDNGRSRMYRVFHYFDGPATSYGAEEYAVITYGKGDDPEIRLVTSRRLTPVIEIERADPTLIERGDIVIIGDSPVRWSVGTVFPMEGTPMLYLQSTSGLPRNKVVEKSMCTLIDREIA